MNGIDIGGPFSKRAKTFQHLIHTTILNKILHFFSDQTRGRVIFFGTNLKFSVTFFGGLVCTFLPVRSKLFARSKLFVPTLLEIKDITEGICRH